MSVTAELSDRTVTRLRYSVAEGVCAFGVACGRQMSGRGGLDEHHPWPVFMGGSENEVKMVACPNHHRRQHALIRSCVEQDQQFPVLTHSFGAMERETAAYAYSSWVLAGRPELPGWNVPAAS